MASSVTLQGAGARFGAGASVSAYPRSHFPQSNQPAVGVAPVGSAAATATVAADGSVTFTGLTDNTQYVVGTSAAGYTSFSTYSGTSSYYVKSSDVGVTGGVAPFNGATAFSRAAFFGHSYVEGNVGPAFISDRWASKVAKALGLEEVNYGYGGSILAQDNGSSTPNNPGGVVTVLNALRPVTVSSGLYVDRTSAPYQPFADLVHLFYGMNDLFWLNATIANTATLIKPAIRTAICRARAGGVFEDSHSSCAYSSTDWTSNSSFPNNVSGTTFRSTTTVGATVTITVPADFPGGEIDLGITTLYGTNKGALYTVTVDGSTHGTHDTRAATGLTGGPSAKVGATVYRITGLAAGTHTIVLTVTALDASGSAYFDYWQMAAPDKPLVVVPNQFHLPASYAWSAGGSPAHATVSNADIDVFNTALAQVVAEFDQYVISPDLLTAFATDNGVATSAATIANGTAGSLFHTDNLHPTSRGHSVIAKAVLAAIAAAPKPAAPTAGAPYWRQVFATGAVEGFGLPNGTEPKFATSWATASVTSTVGAEFSKDASGRVSIRGECKYSGATPTNPATDSKTVIFTLPRGFWPRHQEKRQVVSGTSSTGVVFVNPDGTVNWLAGDPSSFFCLDGITYQADG